MFILNIFYDKNGPTLKKKNITNSTFLNVNI